MKRKSTGERRRQFDRPFEVKSVKADGFFEGHASVFGELDSYRDIVMPGAFKVTLEKYAAMGRMVPMLWQHSSYTPIGVYPELKEDDRGLFVRGHCNMDVQQGREAHALLKQGAISGLSVGYNTEQDETDNKTGVRKLIELDLWEISPVTFPACDGARVTTIKSIMDGLASVSDVERYLREEGALTTQEAKAVISRIKALGAQRDVADTDEAEAIKRATAILRKI